MAAILLQAPSLLRALAWSPSRGLLGWRKVTFPGEARVANPSVQAKAQTKKQTRALAICV